VFHKYGKQAGVTNDEMERLFRQFAANYPSVSKELKRALMDQTVVVLGGGVAGMTSALTMAEMGAKKVYITEVNDKRIAELKGIVSQSPFSNIIEVLKRPDPKTHPDLSNEILEKIQEANGIVGAILIEGAKAPIEVSAELYKKLAEGGKLEFFADIAIDQGGNFAVSKARKYADGWRRDEYGIGQFTVTNMPSMMSKQVSEGIERAKLSYLVALLMGLPIALKDFPELQRGVSIVNGKITHPKVAQAHGMQFYDPLKADGAGLAAKTDKAALATIINGGIDLNTSSGMQWKVSKDGNGVEMDVDPAMIERMKRDGVNWLSPVIFKMTPVTSIWPLVGLKAPVTEGSLVGV
jgi:hypothetical protein